MTKPKIKIENYHQVKTAMQNLDRIISDRHQNSPIPFEGFLKVLMEKPHQALRNVFQVYHDMIKNYVTEGEDEYPNDPESIHFVNYDCRELFVEGSDHPFFADRLFANRFMEQVEALRRGTQQNKIYIFDGPPGCGKQNLHFRRSAGLRQEYFFEQPADEVRRVHQNRRGLAV